MSHAFESWMVATSTASVGLPLRAIIASIVLIMWPHPFAYASPRVRVRTPVSTCSVNKLPGYVPLPGGARWYRNRWQKGREPRIWELVRVAAGASVKAASDRRGDGKWGDSRTGTYWVGRTCTRTCGRCPPRERGSSAFWTLAGWRVIEIALRDSLQRADPTVEKFQRRDADNEPLFAQPSTSVLIFVQVSNFRETLIRNVSYGKMRLILQSSYRFLNHFQSIILPVINILYRYYLKEI